MSKLGLDGHDRGLKIIAKALRDSGMEVIYKGIRTTPKEIVKIAIEEDVDVIGISLLSGAHDKLLPEVCQLLKENDAEDIKVIAGGVIPKNDIQGLKQAGINAVFGPGTELEKIIKYLNSLK